MSTETEPAHSLHYAVVDAFTDKIFSGNPAAVIILDESAITKLNHVGAGDQMLQHIAREFNLSETAFVTPRSNVNEDSKSSIATFGLRWFTPKDEVALCGHATLASAYTLFSSPERLPLDVSLIHFETLSGTLIAKRAENGKVELEFPAGTATRAGEELEKKVKEAVGRAISVEHKVTFVGVGQGVSFGKYMLVELAESLDLQNTTINPGALLDLEPDYTVISFTTKSTSPLKTYVSRTFAPYLGVTEDPVTGSAHCMLGPYWHERLGFQALGVLKAHQVSERGGVLDVIWDQERNTCRLIGEARAVIKGEIFLPAAES